MGEKTRIRVRIGAHEFDAEGPAALVKAQYDQFLKMVGATPRGLRVSLPLDAVAEAMHNRCPGTTPRLPLPSFVTMMNVDCLLLVLYGALALEGLEEVSASDLLTVLKHRGVPVAETERLDRLFASRTGHVIKSGAKRGSKYSLTQEGIRRVEEIIARHLSQKR